MAKPLHAIDYIAAPNQHPPQPVCVVFGDEAFLKRQVLGRIRWSVLGSGDGDFSFSAFDGQEVSAAEVFDELSTMAMFGGGRRLVVVEGGDDFVSRHRSELEDYVARPRATGVLVLELKTFASNTRLYKAAVGAGLVVECGAPPAAQLARWVGAWAKQAHEVQMAASSAEMLIELVGPELGLLDQEMAKLALAVGPNGKVSPEIVEQMVGNWRSKTTWDMLDAALGGDVRGAMTQLDRLILAGESEVGLLGQIAASLRRLAAATRLIEQAEAAGRKMTLGAGLEEAGVNRYVVRKVEQQLRRLGRPRGRRLYRWLLEADLDLKGASALPPRLILERLIVRLAAPA
jgi:DNA polymerase-3 subunit delta